nr:MAG TPA: hypothetical protein [Caudoviricetes sp.]
MFDTKASKLRQKPVAESKAIPLLLLDDRFNYSMIVDAA